VTRRIYGVHAVRAVLDRRPDAVVRALVLDDAADGRLAAIVKELESRGVKVERVERRELDRLTDSAAHQGIVVESPAVAEFSLTDFEQLVVERGSDVRLLVLDGVEDPRNLGACLRTADAAGIDAVVVPRSRAAKLTPAARKVATGAAETLPVLSVPNLGKVLRWLRSAGVRVVGADAAGSSLFGLGLAPPLALVLGGEGRGLKASTRDACDTLAAIPMHGSVESLNVSVAAGIMMYEVVRQSPPGRAAGPRSA
jgi:23S rRNA (guanosine2251-2'-O)-methyltransferase